ncbi:flagellar L-ring protein precursor FlgH [Andreprevotia lacus DSM 23236]|jgi:flagellar L-ring protein precursor FlgH|uniref:Flagellar L-ring protein n=1 Tax=Andreprevotia lacus DSM 23236 TaxID=1121001 RepID=A0A1W1XUX0_9NEIS|nr:flagellar basal body L-ring protein FlgH [Andreprevotia lacus]SMC27696.1 flagellar L-ring protein precursor FlgH [Andreprevotia lacus DSM 23236]
MNRYVTVACALLLCASVESVWAEALYNEQTYHAYVADRRAYRAGDLLTVMVVENSTAATTADTSASRNNDVGLKLDYDNRVKHGASLQVGNDFDAQGRVQRSGRLLAQITVNVVAVRQNGDLEVNGRQMLDINDEKQEILLQGVVRPADVDKGNTVLSSRLGEASIRYAGQGELADRQKPSWWSRLLTVLGW